MPFHPLLLVWTARPLTRMEWQHLNAYPSRWGPLVKHDDHMCSLSVIGYPDPHMPKLLYHILDCRSLRSSTPWQYGEICIAVVHSEEELRSYVH